MFGAKFLEGLGQFFQNENLPIGRMHADRDFTHPIDAIGAKQLRYPLIFYVKENV